MKVWILSKHYVCPSDGHVRPVCVAYSNGHTSPRYADDIENGWALVLCECGAHHIEAASMDPRVEVYRTVWDEITPQTVTAYEAQGAKPGMMLCQLLSLLAKWEPGFSTAA